MKTKIQLLPGFILLAILSLACLAGCKDDDDFGRRSNMFFLNGGALELSTRAVFSSGGLGDGMYLEFRSDEDERRISLDLSFNNLPHAAFRYDFGRTDVENDVVLNLYGVVGGDAICDIYDLDYSVSTNYLEITYFSEEECVVRGSYDLTFIRRERLNGCNSSRFGDTLRLISDYFSIDLQGC